jgi:hypothetical protein
MKRTASQDLQREGAARTSAPSTSAHSTSSSFHQPASLRELCVKKLPGVVQYTYREESEASNESLATERVLSQLDSFVPTSHPEWSGKCYPGGVYRFDRFHAPPKELAPLEQLPAGQDARASAILENFQEQQTFRESLQEWIEFTAYPADLPAKYRLPNPRGRAIDRDATAQARDAYVQHTLDHIYSPNLLAVPHSMRALRYVTHTSDLAPRTARRLWYTEDPSEDKITVGYHRLSDREKITLFSFHRDLAAEEEGEEEDAMEEDL